MSRWHAEACQSPDVYVAGNSVPSCRGCGSSAESMLQRMEQSPSSPPSAPPPDEPSGQLSLTWPLGVRYVRTQSNGQTIEIERPSPQDVSQPLRSPSTSTGSGHPRTGLASATQLSPVYGVTLALDEFRLICLAAVEDESTSHLLHMNLEVHQDHNCPDYEAISYTWGGEDNDSSLCDPIYIGDYWDILLQTKNCWAMLQYLRPKRGIRLVWVDAICINQNDTIDRGNQVSKMGQIYSQCSQVVVWLGSDLVLQTSGIYPRRHRLSELGDSVSPRLPNQKEEHGPLQKNLDISKLLERRYFSRVWVIQELILAPRVMMPIGDLIFWADAATLTNKEGRSTSPIRKIVQKTKAPWFEHLARGSLRVDDFPKLMALTSKSQATDDRDRLFGVLGLYEKQEGEVALLPDYSLSFQHISIGFFAYCIIKQRKFQLLSKARGVSQGRSSLTWMPEWRSEKSWDEVFEDFHEVYEQPEVIFVKPLAEGLLKVFKYNPQGVPPSVDSLAYLTREQLIYGSIKQPKSKYKQSAHETRPWNTNAFVDTDTGALVLDLVRLLSVKSVPILVGPLNLDRPYPALSLYGFQPKVTPETNLYHYIASNLALDQIIEPNDEIFILNPAAPLSPLVYLVLRPTDSDRHFKLVAYSSFLFLGTSQSTNTMDYLKRTHAIGLGLLHGTVAEDIDRISTELGTLVSDTYERRYVMPFTLARIFPGCLKEPKFGTMRIWALLPLFLASARESEECGAGSSEQQYPTTSVKYLAFFPESWRPRATGDFIYFTFEADEWVRRWLGSYSDFISIVKTGLVWEYFSSWKIWKKLGANHIPDGKTPIPGIPFRTTEVTIRCRIDQIHTAIRTLAPHGLLELYKAGLLGDSDSDVEARLRAGPVEEDFKTPSPYRDKDVQEFLTRSGLDGRICQVHIV